MGDKPHYRNFGWIEKKNTLFVSLFYMLSPHKKMCQMLTQSVPVEKCLLPGSQDLAELAKKTTKC